MSEVLEILALGNLIIRYDYKPPTTTISRKAEALLVYLGRVRQPQTRSHLAELFWYERSEDQSLANLRTLLTRIRPQLEPYLTISRDNIELNKETNCWFDANVLEKELLAARQYYNLQSHLPESIATSLEQALELYRGEFLQSFYLPESNNFEEWLSQEREIIQNQVIEALQHLIIHHFRKNKYAMSISFANRLLQLDPLAEEVHRQILVLLVLNGQRSVALTHYNSYQRYLSEELDIAPEAQTTDLYKQIREDKLNFDNWTEINASFESQSPIKTVINQNVVKNQTAILAAKANQLSRVSLFADSPPELLNELAGLLQEVEIKAGETIFNKGDLGQCMYIIINGQMRVHDGKRTINNLAARDIFGEMAVLDSAPRLASVTAITDTQLWRLDQITLYHLMEGRIEVVRGIIEVLSRRLRDRVSEVMELDSRLELHDAVNNFKANHS